MTKRTFKTVDEYIGTFPKDVQALLEEARQTIRDAVPDDAEEVISYQMPTFRLKRNLVHFAAFEKHIGFYPTPSAITAFQEALSPYKSGKGSVQFPLDKPIPFDLIRDMTEFRVEEELRKAKKN